jgi:alanyl-tRNA synthetase
VREEAIAAGTRRIEAVAGNAAREWAKEEAARQKEKFGAIARKKPDVPGLPAFETKAETTEMLKQIDARAAHLEKIDAEVREWEKKGAKASEAQLRSRAAEMAKELATTACGERQRRCRSEECRCQIAASRQRYAQDKNQGADFSWQARLTGVSRSLPLCPRNSAQNFRQTN